MIADTALALEQSGQRISARQSADAELQCRVQLAPVLAQIVADGAVGRPRPLSGLLVVGVRPAEDLPIGKFRKQ